MPNSVLHAVEIIKVKIEFLSDRSLNHLPIRVIIRLIWDFFPNLHFSLYFDDQNHVTLETK